MQIVARNFVRALTTSARRTTQVSMKESASEARGIMPDHPGYEKIIKLQKEWAKDPSIMVWQRRGLRDSVPYYLTVALGLGGMAVMMKTLWDMSWPRKTE